MVILIIIYIFWDLSGNICFSYWSDRTVR